MVITNGQRMFRPLKTMTPYCWPAYSEYGVIPHCVSWDPTPWYHAVAINSSKPILLLLQVTWQLSFGCCLVAWLLSAIAQTGRAGKPRHPHKQRLIRFSSYEPDMLPSAPSTLSSFFHRPRSNHLPRHCKLVDDLVSCRPQNDIRRLRC